MEMKENTIGSRINENYRMHILIKHECLECGKHAILSAEEVKNTPEEIVCPFCHKESLEGVCMMDDPDDLDELGCMGIGHLETRRG